MKTPVLNISQFESEDLSINLYVSQFSKHIDRNKELILDPHSHNFYLCVIFTKGSGTHDIDFRSYEIKPGTVFLLKPGQTHYWKFTSEPDGFIFFHSKELFDMSFVKNELLTFPFYFSVQNPPFVKIPKENNNVLNKFENLYKEYKSSELYRDMKMVNIINDIYIDLSRIYTANIDLSNYYPPRYLKILENFEKLLNASFKSNKLPKYYADQLNISTKHLNRVLKETVNKTTHELISERVIIEAKKMIIQSGDSLVHIADSLEFSDYSYFSKFFKSKTGIAPKNFKKGMKKIETGYNKT
ncbi:MAG: helix-turn-helix transcriptional regulator [Crocinitomicaceae bacterium]